MNTVLFKAWEAAVLSGGDPEEWASKLGTTLEEILRTSNVDMYRVAKALIERRRDDVLNLFPVQLRSYVMLTVAKPARSTTSGEGSTGTTSGEGSTGRGKAYQPKLDLYEWTYKGKTATIRRASDGWAAEYDGEALGVFPTHTKAIEEVYRHNGVEASINAVKLAKLREQDAAAGFADN